MKHGETFYLNKYGFEYFEAYRYSEHKCRCRFRFDPVPGCGTTFYSTLSDTHRSPRTANIKRDESPYNRGKRRMAWFWDRWEPSISRSNWKTKSWKECTRRKRQYK